MRALGHLARFAPTELLLTHVACAISTAPASSSPSSTTALVAPDDDSKSFETTRLARIVDALVARINAGGTAFCVCRHLSAIVESLFDF